MWSLTQSGQLDISAASGVVARDDGLWVIADDEQFLSRYDYSGRPLQRVRLFDEALPDTLDHDTRKRKKADLEALCALPDGRLLTLGSGSKSQRMRGVLVDPQRTVADGGAALQHVDLSPLYARLAEHIPNLNIEGAAVHGETLWLLQRGNGADRLNACIALDAAGALTELTAHARLSGTALRDIQRIVMPDLRGTPLSFTDLTAHPDHGLWFCAAAESTDDTYLDGPCAGSVIGQLSAQAELLRCIEVAPSCKLEGLTFDVQSSGPKLWLVADPDDRTKLAPLFHATLPSAITS